MGPHRPMGLVAPAHDLQVKCPTFSANDYKDAKDPLLHSNDWMDS